MPQSRDDDEQRRPSKPGDHVASKVSASRSEDLRTLVRDVLIVERRAGDGAAIGSMLRAVLGREVEARIALGVEQALTAIQIEPPSLIIWRHGDDAPSMAEAGLGLIREALFVGPVVVVADELAVGEAALLRIAGATEVVEKDELDGVRLSQVLLSAVSLQLPVSRRKRGRDGSD